jgi:hypothetical protein
MTRDAYRLVASLVLAGVLVLALRTTTAGRFPSHRTLT